MAKRAQEHLGGPSTGSSEVNVHSERKHERGGQPYMRVMSLNVRSGGSGVLGKVTDYAEESAVDLVALQELRVSTIDDWRTSLIGAGYEVVDTFSLAQKHGFEHPSEMRRDGLLIASRWPVRALAPIRIEIAWPERPLSVIVKHPKRSFEFHTTHVPNGSQGSTLYYEQGHAIGRDRLEKKIDTLEAVFRAMTKSKLMPRLLAGDFNEPFSESPNGTVQYWQHECPSGLRPILEDRWRVAAHSVFEGLSAHGIHDAFRSRHGYSKSAHSWETNPKHGTDGLPISDPNRYRLDHLFASTDFRVEACDYDHTFRTRGMSDHAAVFADLVGP